ncbi:HAMP domain-containing sensor histidine kinase [Chitinophaga defluvii]|uniref:histidine kinase n=1 Tax=Chitinophaga defluvii TaxID=3163343 RepID=A0ABV2T512_9BACT
MKLLTKTTIYFLIIMLPVLTAGAFYLFFQFNKEIKYEMEEELLNDRLQWIRYLDTIPMNSAVLALSTPEFSITPVDLPPQKQPVLQDVMLFQEVAGQKTPFRQLTQAIPVHGKTYLLTIRKSLIEKNDLIKNVFQVMLGVFAGLLCFTLLLNWLVSKRIWQPFYQSLEKIHHVALKEMPDLQFKRTTVHEFNQLNATLKTMTTRIYEDYVHMKELTEDAAHEMQTPLAIAQNKLELLLQDDALTPAQLQAIAQSCEALQRLSRLNQNLLLLAKIENQQYITTSTINLGQVIEKYLRLLDELIQDKQLVIHRDIATDVQWAIHPFLADTLISNLLGNAIKYNYPQGEIVLHLTATTLTISNTSYLPVIKPEQLFQRFKKSGEAANPDSNGLGLAIVKKITDTNHLNITYNYQKPSHRFIISQTS